MTSTTLLCTCTSTIHPWHHRNCEALTHKEGITEQLKKGAVDELQSSMWIFWMNHYFFSKGSTHFYYCSVFKLPAVKILVNGNMFRYTTWKVWIGEFKYSNSCLLSEKKLWNWIIFCFFKTGSIAEKLAVNWKSVWKCKNDTFSSHSWSRV